MLAYIVRRLMSMIAVLLLVSFLIFLLMDLIPGDPVRVSLGTRATKELVAKRRAAWGLDRPFFVRYFDWLKHALRGDLGKAFYLKQPVMGIIASKLPVTLTIATSGLIVTIMIGIPLGILAAVKKGTWVDKLSIAFATLGVSIPGFWMGLIFILLFGVKLGWFPTGGYVPLSENFVEGIRSLVLPGVSIGLINAAILARMSRSTLLDVLQEMYIQTARSKGLKEQFVVLKHGLRNALLPIITILGMIYASLVGGAVVIETVFTIPGISFALIIAVNKRDFILLQGLILLVAFAFITINLIIDILYVYLNPKVRY